VFARSSPQPARLPCPERSLLLHAPRSCGAYRNSCVSLRTRKSGVEVVRSALLHLTCLSLRLA